MLLPLHDLRGDRALLQERLRRIEAQMQELGESAEGPGNYALGRGALALRRYDEARTRLERAWELGYRTPDAAFALGQVMGAIYERELVAVDRLPTPSQRAGASARLGRLREQAVRSFE